MCEIINKLIDLHHEAEAYKEAIKKLNDEIEGNSDFIKDVFFRKFKIRGIHAKVLNYSLKDNRIILYPVAPDCGVDTLTLTFKEFAQHVEFLE